MELKPETLIMDQDEREEGELSDELEDVSDSSISLVSLMLSGRSGIGREPFRELSLTSVSDECTDDNVSLIEKTKVKPSSTNSKDLKTSTCRRHCKHRKTERDVSSKRNLRYTRSRYSRTKYNSWRKQYSSISSSGSDSERYIPDKKVLRQLRDAVRISSSKKNPNCSLRTRIKRMIEPDSQGSKNSNSDEDPELESLRNKALKSKSLNLNHSEDILEPINNNSSTITDADLIELRLIALRSAVVKKHQNRRKRKELEELEKQQEEMCIISEEPVSNDGNEEELQPKTDIVNNIQDLPVTTGEPVIDKIEDNVNADSKDIEIIILDENGVNQEETKLNTKSSEEIHKEEIIEENIKTKPSVEEDEDILRAMLLTSISKKISNKIIPKQGDANKNSTIPTQILDKPVKKIGVVKKSLKVPTAPINRLVINVNSDSESDSNQTVIKKRDSSNGKNTDLFNKSLSLFLQQARVRSEAEQQSDISKHLPRSQQIEYRRLKRQLQQLSTRIKPHSKVKRVDGTDENKRIRLNSISKKNISKVKLPLGNRLPTPNTQSLIVRSSPVGKQQMNNKVDRLQIKGKYEELAPLMARVSEARSSRDTAQAEVKKLINELRIARVKLTSTHQTYTILIQQLVKAKADVDERTNVLHCSVNQEPVKKVKEVPICTSTPNKCALEESKCELSSIGDQTIVQKDVLMDICPIVEEPCITEMKVEQTNHIVPEIVCEQMGITKYNSPLDHIQHSSEKYLGNPMTVLCPYDLLGVCRDPDCVYRHCGNAGTE